MQPEPRREELLGMITLTPKDWSEIYYALESKSQALRQGKYRPEEEPGQDDEWVAHIDAIRAKIGPDGSLAARAGITPRK
jgi:hypothetical protein